ncbi:hypothetical protein [Paenibacillus brasilensis]|uniref:Uncharacterized protein n=1 Tax=Paenibacillus brasilensis TaxID=128574 RepID=A0ABU0L4X1_9BACL|nr:hypothetical protein [Paenibacillus brasilensis]MDQ0496352.1 hypothetical protein [Paenibacillus brasilensis]
MNVLTENEKFNVELVGYPVYVTGEDLDGQIWSRFFLVDGVRKEHLSLTNSYGGHVTLWLDEVVSGRLKVTVWDGGGKGE